jgi:hypothetical protein
MMVIEITGTIRRIIKGSSFDGVLRPNIFRSKRGSDDGLL